MDKVKFRSSSVWKRKRMEILKRDHKRCKICNGTDGLQVHHIYSLDTHPALKLENSNLITLCSECHHNAHNGVYNQIFLTNKVLHA